MMGENMAVNSDHILSTEQLLDMCNLGYITYVFKCIISNCENETKKQGIHFPGTYNSIFL